MWQCLQQSGKSVLETRGSATKRSSSKDPNQHFTPKVIIRMRSAIDPKPECASRPYPYLRCTLSIVSGRPRTPAPQPTSNLTASASTLLPFQCGDVVPGTANFPCLRPLRPPKTQRQKSLQIVVVPKLFYAERQRHVGVEKWPGRIFALGLSRILKQCLRRHVPKAFPGLRC